MKRVAVVLLLAGPWVVTALAFWLRADWLLPLLCAAVAFPAYYLRLRDDELKTTYGWMAVWTVMQSAALVVLAALHPDAARETVVRGPEYAAEMLHWIRTGVGPEGDPSLFIPIHLAHLAAFCLLCSVSFGFLGLVLGSVLLNYMNFYVVELVRVSLQPTQAAFIGWPVWAVLRVAGFLALALGFSLAGRALWRKLRGECPGPVPKAPLAWGFALVAADALLKAALAPMWRRWLMAALGI